MLADFFERVDLTVRQAEAHHQHLAFPLVQLLEHDPQVLLQELERRSRDRCLRLGVLDEVTQRRILLLAQRGLE